MQQSKECSRGSLRALSLFLGSLVASLSVSERASAGREPERREIAIQDGFAPEDVLRDVYVANGFTNNVIVAPQVAFMSENGTTVEEFLAASDEEIYVRVDQFARRNGLDSESTCVIIIDIEEPVLLHQYYAQLEPHEFKPCVDALKRRLKITREYFPSATLGLYGTVVPHPRGDRWPGTFDSRREVYDRLGEEGVYDDMDVFVPVLYHRFGWDDVVEPWHIFRRLEEMTRQGIYESRRLTDSRGRTKPIYPLVSIEIYNSSLHHETQTDPAMLAYQVGVMRCHGVKQWAIWVGSDPMGEHEIADPLPPLERHTLAEFMQESVCRSDLDGDGRLDHDDMLLFQTYFLEEDSRADLNIDFKLDAIDLNLFVSGFSSSTSPCRQSPAGGLISTCLDAVDGSSELSD